jgi:hypothetical protein
MLLEARLALRLNNTPSQFSQLKDLDFLFVRLVKTH